ncbi:MAG TPA: lysylphosphatidylglycerol synthase domain-containing protein [Acidimicrobiia bacterium]|nr:lysylphosphatidylglycerol synthase domain-containing protein [Acidimicrobiia bacterium]
MKSRRWAHVSTAIGLGVAILGGVFVVRAITSQWSEVEGVLRNARAAWLVAGVVVAGAAMVAVALPWRRALRLVGIDAHLGHTVIWYFVGEIGKYVPGGFWPVVGRGELARRGGLARAPAYASVALSLGALYLSAMLVTAVLVPLRFLGEGDKTALWVLVLLPTGIAALHHRFLGWLIRHGERIMKRELRVRVPRWSASMGLVALYVPAWLLIGTSTWCVARALDPSADWMTVAPAAILSWVVGFVVVPVPGGVGVREAAFIALIGNGIPSGTSATIAIAARVAFMVVDAAGALIGAALVRGSRSRAPLGPQPD